MAGFFGRETERGKLSTFNGSGGQSVALIYGRRRVGKSELIKQALGDLGMRRIYYECKQTSEANNVGSLAALASEALGYPRLAFDDMEGLLDFLFDEAEKAGCALVLDEYPYLRDVVPGLDGILQSIVDAHAASSRMKLVLCGSYVDVMKSLLEEENPLYGRVDLTIHLKPMDYLDSAMFYPFFSDKDKVRLYSVFGGIPYYNRLIDPGKSVRDNIIDLVASPGARLENEVVMYLRSEIRKIVNANEVFEALASGHSRFGDILDQSHVSRSVVEQEISQVRATGLDCSACGFISRSGFEDFDIDGVRKYTLADVYRG